MILSKFFKWLYNPNEPDSRKRITSPCMIDIRKLPRKERSSYKPSSLWDATEHAIFLKYCLSKRDRCYHATANDMSARPLALRIPLYSVSEIFISLRILFVKVGIVSDAVICCKQIRFERHTLKLY